YDLLNFIATLVSVVASFIFVVFLVMDYHSNKKINKVYWIIGFSFFTVASLCDFLFFFFINYVMYVLYLASVTLLVTFLSIGELYFLNLKNNYRIFIIYYLYAFSIITLASVLFYSMPSNVLTSHIFNSASLPSMLIVLPMFVTLPGTAILVIGPLYSVFKNKASSKLPQLMISIGFFIVAVSTGVTIINIQYIFSLGIVIGLAMVFWGAVRSSNKIK
ncbi:MAG: hypothetical protein ACP5UL_03905, partial [Thermoplasmata archaeon]